MSSDTSPSSSSAGSRRECTTDISGKATATGFKEETFSPHWFYKDNDNSKELWYGFSIEDSEAIEEAYSRSLRGNSNLVVPTGGGRYDVYLKKRQRKPVYWEAEPNDVRRGTWFYKADGRYHPYDEDTSLLIEKHYQKCLFNAHWDKNGILVGENDILMENPQTVLHCTSAGTRESTEFVRRTVTRGVPKEMVILPHEIHEIDHLILVVEGIGPYCDWNKQDLIQCLDRFRALSNLLLPLTFKPELDSQSTRRVEFLPVMWHSSIRDSRFDARMSSISLPSIPKFRFFISDCLMDVLLYMTPLYAQTIINKVAGELNRLYNLFIERNPRFEGKICVLGHSLGSLILFDILANQAVSGNGEVAKPDSSEASSSWTREMPEVNCDLSSLLEEMHLQEYLPLFLQEKMDVLSLLHCSEDDLKELNIPMGPRKKFLQFIHDHRTKTLSCKPNSYSRDDPSRYQEHKPNGLRISTYMIPYLQFHPDIFFALGSPISVFLVARGFPAVNEDFTFPTCRSFFHIFHPYDPIAFRIETAIDPSFTAPAVTIPHHKGGKQLHVEILENIAWFHSEIKQKLLNSFKYSWDPMNWFGRGKSPASPEGITEERSSSDLEGDSPPTANGGSWLGKVNSGGRRIDYVLQARPIEAFSEYIFAILSHTSYWNSEDTASMILREAYAVQDNTT